MDTERPSFFSREVQEALEKLSPTDRELVRSAHEAEIQALSESVRQKTKALTESSDRNFSSPLSGGEGSVKTPITVFRRKFQYRHLFEQTSLWIYQATLDGKFTDMNPALAKMLWYDSPSDAIDAIDDISHQMYAIPANRGINLANAEKSWGSVVVENCYRKKDGSIWFGILHLHFVKDERGTPFLEGFIEDITQRKEAEREVFETAIAMKRLNGQLTQSHERLQAIIDHNMDAVIRLDVHGRVSEWNRKAEEMFGYSRQEAMECRLSKLIIPESMRDRHERAIARFSAESSNHLFSGRILELSAVRKDGTELPVEISVSYVPGTEGYEFCGFVRDISERKSTERELAEYRNDLENKVAERTFELVEATKAAEAANRAKSTFLSNMSHEIRTPMNGILGMLGILMREGVTPKQAERLWKIELSGKHLLRVINDILDISKIEAGMLILEKTQINVDSLVADVCSMVSEKAAEKGIRLSVEWSGGWPSNIVGDATRLRQGLLNYVSNALKFTHSGTITLRTIPMDETDEWVEIRFEVEDTGIGIPKDSLSRIFSPFEQADNSTTRKYGGTGLGLAIAKRLAEHMGGTAWVESEPDKWSLFWFTVRLDKEERRTSSEKNVDYFTVVRERFGGCRVLVVDDEPINREIVAVLLEDAGLIVSMAEDGCSAIEMMEKTDYSAVFMDMQMPKLDGLEATLRIRHIPKHAHVPILAMTANAFAEDRKKCFDVGMDDFIVKPFDPNGFFEKLFIQLDRRSKRKN